MWLRSTFVLTATAFGSALSILGQAPTATIRGVVLDPSQAAVPGAKVTVENSATGLTRTALSGQLGDYLFPALAPGVYSVKAESPGFRTAKSPIELLAGRVNTTEYKVDGVMARLQPGVLVTSGVPSGKLPWFAEGGL